MLLFDSPLLPLSPFIHSPAAHTRDAMAPRLQRLHQLALEQELWMLETIEGSSCRPIYRVPSGWRKVNPSDFVPIVLPLAFANRRLDKGTVSVLKMTIRDEFLEVKRQKDAEYSWAAHKQFLKIDVQQMREMYSLHEIHDIRDNTDVEEVLALDALVAMILLILFYVPQTVPHLRTLFGKVNTVFPLPSLRSGIVRDMLLLEQQLPMSLLHKTLTSIVSVKDSTNIVLKSTLDSLLFWTHPLKKPRYRLLTIEETRSLEGPDGTVQHLLEYLYQAIIPERDSNGRKERDSYGKKERDSKRKEAYEKLELDYGATAQVPSVVGLGEAGIKVELDRTAVDITDVTFKGAALKLPQLQIHSSTVSLLRNLAAFEILVVQRPQYMCPYLKLMAKLAETEQDVRKLVKATVIENLLGTESEVKKALSGVCSNMPISSPTSTWHEMLTDIKEYYENEKRALWNEFKRTHFSKPWVAASTLAAIFLLSFAFLQTLYSILGLYKKSS